MNELLRTIDLLLNAAGELGVIAAVQEPGNQDNDWQRASNMLLDAGESWARHVSGQYLRHPGGAVGVLSSSEMTRLHRMIGSPLLGVADILERVSSHPGDGSHASRLLPHVKRAAVLADDYLRRYPQVMESLLNDASMRHDLLMVFGDILSEPG